VEKFVEELKALGPLSVTGDPVISDE